MLLNPVLSRCAGWMTALLLALSAAGATAGPLDPPAAPTNPASAMFTLTDLYNRLNAGTAGGKRSGVFVGPPAGAITETGYTLDEIMAKMPTVDAAGAVAADVLAPKKFWGLTSGVWGLREGTATARNSFTGVNGVKVITIPDGLYSGNKTATAVDSALDPTNIKKGVTIFETLGTFTDDGNAGAGDLLIDKKAYVNGALVTGTMPNITTDQASTARGVGIGVITLTAPQGYYDGTDKVTATDAQVAALDADITAANIKSTITIFGVAGNTNVVDTSSGDAVAADLATGKKAWVDGAEVTGTASGATAAVPKTGQTTSSATGDDGDLEKGVTWPNPHFKLNVIPANDDGSNGGTSNDGICNGSELCDGTVTDNLTGLMWIQNANAGSDCDGADTGGKTWAIALSSAAACNTSSYAGYTDWRLPNVNELLSLIDRSRFNPALPSASTVLS